MKRGKLFEGSTDVRFWLGVFLGTSYAIIFFLFLILSREIMRLALVTPDQHAVIVLSLSELLFFNFFFAFVSCLMGAQKFYEYSLYSRSSRSPLYIRNSIWTDYSGPIWYFLHIFGKLAIVWGIFGSITSGHLNFFEEYWWLFLLILVALFFNQTNKYRFFFASEARVWIPKLALFYVTASLFITLVTSPSSIHYNRLVNSYSIWSSIDIQTPTSTIDRLEARFGLVFNIYYGFKKNAEPNTEAIALGPKRFVDSAELSQSLIKRKSSVAFFERDFLINIKIDKRISFSKVSELLLQLRTVNTRKILFATNESTRGISLLLNPPCEELVRTDSIPVISCAELKEVTGSNLIKRVDISGQKIYLNGKEVSRQSLEGLALAIQRENPETIFVITADEKTSFGDFVSVLEMILKANLTLRDRAARQKFGTPYLYDDCCQSWEINEYMAKHHPLNIFIPSAAETELIFD